MTSRKPTRIVALDATVLSNLLQTDRIHLLGSLGNHGFVVPAEVVSEITEPEHTKMLNQAIDAGHFTLKTFSSPTELELYADHKRTMGIGQSACLAMAEVHNWCVASDHRDRFLNVAKTRLGAARILNTRTLVLLAFIGNPMTAEIADHLNVPIRDHLRNPTAPLTSQTRIRL